MTELGKDNSGGMDDEAYDFPLFSKGSGSESALQRIILRSPTPRSLNPGFLTARRPDGYYFNAPSSEEQMQQYRETAVSSEDVRKELKQKWVDFYHVLSREIPINNDHSLVANSLGGFMLLTLRDL